MADESRAGDATVVVGVGAGGPAAAPGDESTVLIDRAPAPAAATVVAPATITKPAQSATASGGWSTATAPGITQPVAPAAASRPLWLAVALGVCCGLALFAATALLLLRA